MNRSSRSATHVLLALGYGVCDPHMRALNRVIVQLLVARLRAERRHDHKTSTRIQETLTGLHVAIDWATGTLPPLDFSHAENPLCNKVRPAEQATGAQPA